MKYLLCFLPQDRARPGYFHLFDSHGVLLMEQVPCLGKADNARAAKAANAGRDPVLPYGDTPTGIYRPEPLVLFEAPHPRLGKGWIPMFGLQGDAATAVECGRTGLGLHAGRGDDRLVPTYGCLRITDLHFDRLAECLDGDAVEIRILEQGR